MTFQNIPIWLNRLIFAAAAVAIWYAGTKLARYTDAISNRTRLPAEATADHDQSAEWKQEKHI